MNKRSTFSLVGIPGKVKSYGSNGRYRMAGAIRRDQETHVFQKASGGKTNVHSVIINAPKGVPIILDVDE